MPPGALSHLAGHGRGQLQFCNWMHLDEWEVWYHNVPTPDLNSVIASLPEMHPHMLGPTSRTDLLSARH